MMLDTGASFRIASLRHRIFRCIEDELRRDNMHKSYEGAIDVSCHLPNYFESESDIQWSISLSCYVMRGISGRHVSWKGKTLNDALVLAENEVNKLCDMYEFARFEKAMGLVPDSDDEMDKAVENYPQGPNKHDTEQPF